MYSNFLGNFIRDAALSVANEGEIPLSDVSSWNDLINMFGGNSYNNGLYRIICRDDIPVWQSRVTMAFPEFGGPVSLFGYDWLGRAFGIAPEVLGSSRFTVVMFEPGTGEILEIPCSIASFHNEELVEYGDAALAEEFQKKWLANGGRVPSYRECVGYKVPLWLGGSDNLENLHVVDLDVYWHLAGQIRSGASGSA